MDKKKKKSLIIQYALLVVLAAAILVMLIYMIPYRFHLNKTITFAPDNTLVDNPLMGYAPDARSEKQCADSRLVFINLTWAEWEPREGQFAVAAIEEKYHIARWKSENKHAVIRFVCDIPGDEAHIDIPEWVYGKTGDGYHYDSEYGKGYSPNYENDVFVAAHENALRRLGEYCEASTFVSFVELGSLGHWGEWHASDDDGRSLMPEPSVCEEYVLQYVGSFKRPKLLMRRSYEFAVENGIGFYNDMVGHTEDTETWLDWLRDGGRQRTSGEDLLLVPAENPGMLVPVGGEFTSSVPMEEIFGDAFGDTLVSISDSHMTFLGPKTPDLTDEDLEVERNSVLRRMGYRIYVSTLQTQYDFTDQTVKMDFTWKNAGNAGFFFQWPVMVYIYDGNRELVYWESLELDLRELNGGAEVKTSIKVPFVDQLRDEFYVGIRISDVSGTDSLELAIDYDGERETIDGVGILYHYTRH